MDVRDYQVPSVPPTTYYIPNFITESEESQILRQVNSVPKPKWTCLSNRRLQDYGGVPHAKGMITEKIPDWLQRYIDKVNALGIFGDRTPNQVLVNEYLPKQGIMPHTDGPLFAPIIATISCGSHTILELMENNEDRRKVCSLLLERRSLVIIKDDLYTKYLHSINEKDIDVLTNDCANLDGCAERSVGDELVRSTRVSLTIRHVPKTLKIKFHK